MAPIVLVGIAGESLSNRNVTKLGTGLYRCRSFPDGDWEPLADRVGPDPEVRALLAVPGDRAILYAGTQAGVHRSRDGGDTWELLAAPRPRFGVWSLAVHPTDPNVLLAGVEPAAVLRSQDGGDTWSTPRAELRFPEAAASYPKRPMSLTFDPIDPDTVYCAIEVGGILRSTDGGRSWENLPPEGGADRVDFHGTAVTVAGLCAAGRIGIFLRARGAGQWRHQVSDRLVFRGAAGTGLDAEKVFGSVAGVSRERFGGNVFVAELEVLGPDTVAFTPAVHTTGRQGYGGPFDRRGIGARRGGEGRERSPACLHAYLAIAEAILRASPGATLTTGLGRTLDAGVLRAHAGVWLPRSDAACDCHLEESTLTRAGYDEALRWFPLDHYARCATVSPHDPRRVFVGAGAGYQSSHGVLYRSDDGGASWSTQLLPAQADSPVFALATSASHHALACVTKLGQVFLSGDDGETWRSKALPAEAWPAYSLAVA